MTDPVCVPSVLCPVMIGFAAIIFSHPEFADALPILTKLVFASSVVHQLVVTSLSPLPFAIGQVQDTGMIFLASMAASIMTQLGPTVPLEERVATVLAHLSISTMLVGVGLILTGKARLASLVQYLPTPVIGGYLAYVGFFMVKGGISHNRRESCICIWLGCAGELDSQLDAASASLGGWYHAGSSYFSLSALCCVP